MRSIIKYCILFFSILSFALNMSAKDFTVVIDPGHGGKDYGALGTTAFEKNINLNVALKLGDLIKSKMDNVKVVYTRDGDYYLTLQERADIANKASGDLFISIHTNSIDKKSKNRTTIKGAATYTLGLHRSEENLEVAKRENSVIALEKDYTTTYQGFDPNSTESYIIFEIFQNVHMDQSIDFAKNVQSEFVRTAGRTDNGVRQAGFWVLAKTSMPAVLVELDFICNPTQESFLSSDEGQEKMAKAIFNAFCDYKKNCDRKNANPLLAAAPVKNSKNNKKEAKKEAEQVVASSEPVVQNDEDGVVIDKNEYKYSTRKRGNKISVDKEDKKTEKETKPIKEKKVVEQKPIVVKDNKKYTAPKAIAKVKEVGSDAATSNGVIYRIQFLTSLKELPAGSTEFKGLDSVACYSDNGLFKYTYGATSDKNEASSMLKIVKLRFKEAFIVPFKNNKRVAYD